MLATERMVEQPLWVNNAGSRLGRPGPQSPQFRKQRARIERDAHRVVGGPCHPRENPIERLFMPA
jgi:hypothetical protein